MKTGWRNFLALRGSLVLKSTAFSIDENEAFTTRAAPSGMPSSLSLLLDDLFK